MNLEIIALQIDLGRQKESIEYIKSYVDFAKESGYNAIFYYIENAVRTPDTEFLNPEETYSLSEMREIVNYTEGLGLTAIPAFENLGHMEKFLSYPHLKHLAECPDGKGARYHAAGNGDCGCVSEPAMYEFMDKYITDVLTVFTSELVHMGLDEVFSFAVCPKCRARLAAGETKADMFYQHIMHTHDLLSSLGKTMMMWDDFFECMDIVARLPRDIIFTNWNYIFVSDELPGHWTNKVKRDWLRYYDELGFRYMFCALGHRLSSIYNLDTLTSYAQRHKPMGAIMTTWERSNDFYLCTYPLIALAGGVWSGKYTLKDALKVYTGMIGDEKFAKLILSISHPYSPPYTARAARIVESEYLSARMFRTQMEYALGELHEMITGNGGIEEDIRAELYTQLFYSYVEFKLIDIGTRIFDKYEISSPDFSEIEEEVRALISGVDECEAIASGLWNKYREGILSCNDAFRKRFISIRERLNDILNDIKRDPSPAILYLDLMLHDNFCTVKGEINVKYSGEECEELLYTGPIKSSLASFDNGGCYGIRLAIKNAPVDYITFASYGEGSIFPLNFRYVINGKKYVASTAEVISGDIKDIENVLYNDTEFATFGNNCSYEHFNNIDISGERHTAKITFKPIAEYKSQG